MFERFTERARQVVVLAQDEARALKHNYIGTEHLLLGLLREEEGIAARVLESLLVSVEEVRAQVARIVGQGDDVTPGLIPFTPRAKRVLELSLREALTLGHSYISTEHILLGVVRESDGVAARILLDFDADADTVRERVTGIMAGGIEVRSEPAYEPPSPPVSAEVVAEMQRLRSERETAIGNQDFERAAKLRYRERHLTNAARALARAWAGHEPYPPIPELHEPRSSTSVRWRRMSRRAVKSRSVATTDLSARNPTRTLLPGWPLFAVALGIGILIGWLIWG